MLPENHQEWSILKPMPVKEAERIFSSAYNMMSSQNSRILSIIIQHPRT